MPSSRSRDSAKNRDRKRTSVFDRLGISKKSPKHGAERQSSSATAPDRQEKCRIFLRSGNCPYGAKCKFLHEAPPSKSLRDKERLSGKEEISPGKHGRHVGESGESRKRRKSSKVQSRVIVSGQELDSVSSSDDSGNYDDWKAKKEKEKMMDYQEVLLLEKQRQKLQRELELELQREQETEARQNIVIAKRVSESSGDSDSSSGSSSSSSSSSSSGSSSSGSSSSTDSESESPSPVKHKKHVAKRQLTRDEYKKKVEHKSCKTSASPAGSKHKQRVQEIPAMAHKKKKVQRYEAKLLSLKEKKALKRDASSSSEPEVPKRKNKLQMHKQKYEDASPEPMRIDKHHVKKHSQPPLDTRKAKKGKDRTKLIAERKSITPARIGNVKGKHAKREGIVKERTHTPSQEGDGKKRKGGFERKKKKVPTATLR